MSAPPEGCEATGGAGLVREEWASTGIDHPVFRTLCQPRHEGATMTIKESQSPRDRSPSIAFQQVQAVIGYFPDGRLVPLRSTGPKWKAPVELNWLERPINRASRRAAVRAVSKGQYLGAVPASFGAVVVDIDEGGDPAALWVKSQLGEPVIEYPTGRGRHLWYSVAPDAMIGKTEWWHSDPFEHSDFAGQLIGSSGQVVLWEGEAFSNGVPALTLGACTDVDLSPLMAPASRDVAPVQPSNVIQFPGEPAGADTAGPVWKDLRDALDWYARKADTCGYDEWIEIGQALHFESCGSAAGFAVFDAFSIQFENYPGGNEQSTADKWQSFGKRDGKARGTIFQLAQLLGWSNPRSDIPEVNPVEEFDDLSPPDDDRPTNRSVRLLALPLGRELLARILDDIGYAVGYNERSAAVEFSRTGGPFEPLVNVTAAELRADIARWYQYVPEGWSAEKRRAVKFNREDWRENTEALSAARRFDPFTDWLASLPAWDKRERLDTLISDLWELPDDSDDSATLARWAGKWGILVAAVRRAYEPGCKQDEMVVLIGRGDLGKSTFCVSLFPDEHQGEWFADNYDFSGDSLTRLYKRLGTVIVEATEMKGIGRVAHSDVKGDVSGARDKERLKYHENAESYPRRGIMIGTADRDGVLPRDKNLRRWIPIKIDGPSDGDALARRERYLGACRSAVSDKIRGRPQECREFTIGSLRGRPRHTVSSPPLVAGLASSGAFGTRGI